MQKESMDKIISQEDIFGQPQMKMFDVTPAVARQWLDRNIGNRPITTSAVNRYARDMIGGKWRMTGDPIRFSKTGKLIDGQHRLTAIVKTGVTVSCVVMTGLDDEIFDVIDTGRSRSKSDVLVIEHGLPVETSKLLSSSAALAYSYVNELYSFKPNVTNKDLSDFIRDNPDLINATQHVREAVPHESPAPKAVAVAFYYFASKLDQTLADRFIERFMVGAVDGANDNLLHLRNACFNARACRRPIRPSDLMWRLIKIWNSERRGKPIAYFSNTGVRNGEAFPKFI